MTKKDTPGVSAVEINELDGLIKRYSDLLASIIWQKTPLLQVYYQRMSEMLINLNRLKSPGQEVSGGSVVVFVTLYHDKGGSLSIWEGVLRKIQYSVSSRPVFLCKSEAEKATGNNSNESYVRLVVPKKSVLLCEGGYRIRQSAVSPQGILSFHWGGQSYEFGGGGLLPVCRGR